ncbi:unnamed protein product, partial [Rotaria socialis]
TAITTATPIQSTECFSLITPNDIINPIWNTKAGGNSFPASPGYGIGQYPPHEGPQNAFDLSVDTKYLSFGNDVEGDSTGEEGLHTGFYVTPNRDLSCAQGFYFTTADDFPERDPMMITIEGSYESNLTLGSSWNLIYNGPSGLEIDPGRKSTGMDKYILDEQWFASYRVLVTAIRDQGNATQYSQFHLVGNDGIEDNFQVGLKTTENDSEETTSATVEKKIKYVLRKCRRLVSTIKYSNVFQLFLRDLIQEYNNANGIKIKRSLQLDVRTLWNSTHYMLEAFIIFRPIIDNLFKNIRKMNLSKKQANNLTKLEMSSTCWDIVELLLKVLTPF